MVLRNFFNQHDTNAKVQSISSIDIGELQNDVHGQAKSHLSEGSLAGLVTLFDYLMEQDENLVIYEEVLVSLNSPHHTATALNVYDLAEKVFADYVLMDWLKRLYR